MGDFNSLWVLALAGMKEGFIDLVFMCAFSCCILNQLLCRGCFAAFLAKDSDNLALLPSSLSRSVCARAFS